MTAIKLTFKDEAIEGFKKAIGGMRTVFTSDPEGAENGRTALDKAKAAFQKAKAIADSEGVLTFAQDDEHLSQPGMQPTVAIVGARDRDEKTGKMNTGVRAIVMFGIPDANSFITYEDSDGKNVGADWVEKLIIKEASHVFFRDLRNADSAEGLAASWDDRPKDVAAFIASYVGEGLDTDAFDKIWPGLRKMLNDKLPALVKLLPGKQEVLKAIRSKAYALSDPELKPLEEQNIFKFLADSMIKSGAIATNEAGESDPIDTTAIQNWLAERDTYTFREAPKAEKDFSILSGLNLGVIAAPAAAPAEQAPAEDNAGNPAESEAEPKAAGRKGK